MANARQILFPYGMARNPDGSWTFFNRRYKVCGTNKEEWSEWNDSDHKLFLKGLGPKTLAKLDVNGDGDSERIYFYNDETNPEISKSNMDDYLAKLRVIIGLDDDWERR